MKLKLKFLLSTKKQDVYHFHLKQQHLDHGMALNKNLLLVMLSKVKLNA